MIYIIIFYLIGYVIAYRIGSKVDREVYTLNSGNDDKYDWNDVFFNMLLGLISWVAIIIYLYWKYIKNSNIKSKPPRWL